MLEEQNGLSSEEIAKEAETRTLSDAELLKKGANFTVDKDETLRLEATQEEINEAHKEMSYEQDKNYRMAVDATEMSSNILRDLQWFHLENIRTGEKLDDSQYTVYTRQLDGIFQKMEEFKTKYGFEIVESDLDYLKSVIDDRDAEGTKRQIGRLIDCMSGAYLMTKGMLENIEPSVEEE